MPTVRLEFAAQKASGVSRGTSLKRVRNRPRSRPLKTVVMELTKQIQIKK
jgi:hypothetical protein